MKQELATALDAAASSTEPDEIPGDTPPPKKKNGRDRTEEYKKRKARDIDQAMILARVDYESRQDPQSTVTVSR